MRAFLRRNGIDPDKDVALRAIGGSALRAAAMERGIVAAAPFAPEDTVRLMRSGFPMIANLSDTLNIPQSVVACSQRTVGEVSGGKQTLPQGFGPGNPICKNE
jgi:ABC-type nitrate/sulfonate/bicarbonate transport system substrate-binding protein